MVYVKTRYQDLDLVLKADRKIGVKNDAVVRYFQQAYVDLHGPQVKTSSGKIQPMIVDGSFGPQTENGLLAFQEACHIPRTGVFDQVTQNELDWRVYGELNGAWTHASVSHDNMGEGGPAIVRGSDGKAYNGLVVSEHVPVNSQGASRESSRLSRVNEARLGFGLGFNGSVLRFARGTTSNSSHSEARAGDDMGDQNANRIIDGNEMVLLKGSWDYYIWRSVGLGDKPQKYIYQSKNLQTGIVSTHSVYYVGRDRLTTMVLGNLRYPGGPLMFPGFTYYRDVAVTWSPNRGGNLAPGQFAQMSTTVHTAPFHLHSDCIWGAPHGSPFA